MGLFRLSGMGMGFFAAVALVTPAMAQEADLKPVFAKDAASAYSVVTKVKQGVDSPMGKQNITVDQDVGFAMKVVEASETGAKVELTIEGIKFNMTGMMSESFDSAQPAESDAGMYAPTLRDLVGKKVLVSMNADGTYASIEGLDDVLDEVTDAQFAEQIFSEEQIKDTMESIFHAKDDATLVKVGDTWSKDRVQEDEMGKLTTKIDTTVESIAGTEVNMTFGGSSSLEAGEAAGMGMKTEMKDSVVKGKGVWSTEVGALKSMELTQTATMMITGAMNATVQLEATRTVTRK